MPLFTDLDGLGGGGGSRSNSDTQPSKDCGIEATSESERNRVGEAPAGRTYWVLGYLP